METLRQHLRGPYLAVPIDFNSPRWHVTGNIPPEAGWYYIETNAPLDVIARQTLWQSHYTRKHTQAAAPVKNYDLESRCTRYRADMRGFWNIRQVYSGLASNLMARAREHTFADPGTAGLALFRYPELHEYEWVFNFLTLASLMPNCPDSEVLLRLGEQVWRSENGWPVLCAK